MFINTKIRNLICKIYKQAVNFIVYIIINLFARVQALIQSMSHSPKNRRPILANSAVQNNNKNSKCNVAGILKSKQQKIQISPNFNKPKSSPPPSPKPQHSPRQLASSPRSLIQPLSSNSHRGINSPKSDSSFRVRLPASPCSSNIQTQIQQLQKAISAMEKTKQKLFSLLQIYELMDSSKSGQRCFKHDNDLSLYCLNERKILCVNCFYGDQKHRCHKVMPLKDSLLEVEKDNESLLKILESQKAWMGKSVKIIEQVIKNNTINHESQMKDLQKKYKKRQLELEQEYKKNKEQLASSVRQLASTHQVVKKYLQDFKYSADKVYYIVAGWKANKQGGDIMKQTLGVSVVQIFDDLSKVISGTWGKQLQL